MTGSARVERRIDRWRDRAMRGTGWRRRYAARRLARAGTPAAARALVRLFLSADHYRVRDIARQALSTLADQDARDAACEVAIASGNRRLSTVLTEAGHLPSDPGRRALWLLLNGRFDEAAELDFDGDLVRAAYRSAGPGLRRRIADSARTAGRGEWFRTLAAEARVDWDRTLGTLATAGRWEELWPLVIAAPLPWAARLLSTMGENGWLPGAEAEREGYRRLVALADRCASPPSTASLYQEPRMLAKHFCGFWSGGTYTPFKLSECGDVVAMIEYRDGAYCGRLWRLPAGELMGEFPVPGKHQDLLAVSPKGTMVVIRDERYRVRLRELPTGRETDLIPGAGWGIGSRFIFTRDSEWLVGATMDRRVWLWHVPSGQQTSVRRELGEYGEPQLAVSANGRILAAWSGSHAVELWRLPSGDRIGAVGSPDMTFDNRLPLLVTPNGRRLVVAGGGRAHMWELPSLRLRAAWSVPSGHPVMSADGRLVSFSTGRPGARGGRLEVRRTTDGELTTVIEPGRGKGDRWTTGLAVSRDGRLLARINRAGRVRLWHLPSGAPAGRLARKLYKSIGALAAFEFAAGDVVLAWGEKRVRLWRPEPVLLGRTPVGRVTVPEAERLREHMRSTVDQPWGELLAALVYWRHRHDIELRDTAGTPTATDVEVAE